MGDIYKQPFLIKVIGGISCIVLLCVLIATIQWMFIGTKAGPETISCAEDESAVNFPVSQKERIFFDFNTGGLSGPHQEKIQALDVSQGSVEDILYVLKLNGLPSVSPSETHFVYNKYSRNEESRSLLGDKKFTYYQPTVRAIDGQKELAVPIEIERSDLLSWSPDGNCLVIISEQKSEMGLYHLSNGQYESWSLPRRAGLMMSRIEFRSGSLSPNGRWLAGLCGQEICVMKANGEIVHRVPGNIRLMSIHGFDWSPDGQYLLIREGEWQLSYLDANSGWIKQPLIDAPKCQQNCEAFSYFSISDWSPDGTKLAGIISQPSYHPIVVIEFPSGNYYLLGPSLKYPVWSPDSTKLVVTKLDEAYLQPAGIYTIRYDGQDLKLLKETKQGEEVRALFWTKRK